MRFLRLAPSRRWLNSLTLVASLACFAPSPASAEEVAHSRTSLDALLPCERSIIEHANARRTAAGLRPLQLDLWLQNSARRHAAWMTRSRALQHTSAMVAENIAMGQTSGAEAVRDWMNSPGHRANLLHGEYTRIGAAAYRAEDGTCYWCVQFLR